jgi:hypothetical protein
MQSKPNTWRLGEWNDFGPWPTRDILDQLGIMPGNLALLASFRRSTGDLIYLPVEVLVHGAPLSSSTYTVEVKSSWNLHAIETSIINPSGKIEELPIQGCSFGPTCILYDADTPFSINLNLNGQPEGVYRFHIVGRVPNNSLRPELSVKIYHRQS